MRRARCFHRDIRVYQALFARLIRKLFPVNVIGLFSLWPNCPVLSQLPAYFSSSFFHSRGFNVTRDFNRTLIKTFLTSYFIIKFINSSSSFFFFSNNIMKYSKSRLKWFYFIFFSSNINFNCL